MAASADVRPRSRPRPQERLRCTASARSSSSTRSTASTRPAGRLLPHVEDGTVTLIGATTENPYFEVNAALLSRMRVWRLEPLTDEDVATVVRRAIADADAGSRRPRPDGGVAVADEAFDHLVSLAGGDARAALNVLEGAVALAEAEGVRTSRAASRRARGRRGRRASSGSSATTAPATATTTRCRRSSRACAATTRRRAVLAGAMIAAGEDPKFIARRLIISASEDVGNADPRALTVAVAAAQALDWVGCPKPSTPWPRPRRTSPRPEVEPFRSAYWAAVVDVDDRARWRCRSTCDRRHTRA
jgi:putative ATPase